MAYIGKTPVIGNFVKLDSITVVNGQAAYTMQNGGVNFTSYDNVNQFLVSLNGVLQAPTDSFTVSGSTLTFASNLSTGDVIDFVLVLGNSLDIGTPSDNTVSTAKLADSSVTSAKLSGSLVTPSDLEVVSSGTPLNVNSTNDEVKKIQFENSGSAVGYIGSSSGTPIRVLNGSATELMRIDSSSNLKFNSGFGSVTTVYGCRAWVNFTQVGTQTIRGSGGVSSLTDQGTGATDVNFSTNMPDTNYAECLSLARGLLSTGAQQFPITVPNAANVGYAEVASRQCDNDNNTFTTADAGDVYVSFFR
jgi:hypothetical protein